MQQITKDVYHISLMPRSSINCYIIEGVLIDSGIRNSYKKIIESIQKIPVHLHILTHAHADHQGCSDYICKEFNLPLYCHENEVYRTETGLVTKDYPSNGIIARLQQKYWAGQGHKVDKTIKENDTIGNFRVIETPGHSDGHVFIIQRKRWSLNYWGCSNKHELVNHNKRITPSIFTTNKVENINSLQKLSELNPKIICFGHGPILLNKNKEFEKFIEKVRITNN